LLNSLLGEEMADAAPARTPADFLKSIKGRTVIVKLNSGVDYRGASRLAHTLAAGRVDVGPRQASWPAWTAT
jgi:hypothetical protein